MAESNTNVTEKIEVLWQYCAELLRSTSLLHKLGYGLLLLALIDFIQLMTPPRFMDPVWEFQTFGAIVERVVVLLLGLALVFFGEKNGRWKGELPLLRGLYWLTLVLAVLFFLMIPLGIINTLRIDRQNQQQITTQIERGRTQIQQIQQQMQGITTQEQMEDFLNRLNGAGGSPQLGSTQKLNDIKQQLASTLTQGEKALNTQAQQIQANQRLNLLKNSVKWNLGALITGALLLAIWQESRWVR